MDSKEEPNAGGHRHNPATENSDTMALQKKRARRVSFAEMTSVHFFDRDEEYNETPLMETAKFGDDSTGGELGFGGHTENNKEFRGEDDGDDNDDDEEMEMRRSFLRPIGSPSPGGSTCGSASSNDEDNFFGPVSANFIRSSQLSDSAASDDNHDVTMDSTAFSMHYRSLARSDSGVDFKTPTGGQLFFEEKTPTNPNIGSSMIFTLGKKPIPKSSVPVMEVSGSHSSNDMSLVGENSKKYDYEKLSPGLDALLAESRRNLLSVTESNDITTSMSPERKEGEVLPSIDHGDNFINLSDYVTKETERVNSHDILNRDESAARSEFVDANGTHGTFPIGCSPKNISSTILGAPAANGDNYKSNRSAHQWSKNESQTPLVASAYSPVKQHQIVLTTASPSKHLGPASPLAERHGSLVRNENVEHQEIETSIQKSISKLELLEKSAFSSNFSAKVDKSTIKSLDFSKSPNIDMFLENNRHISRINFVEDSVPEEKLTSAHQSKERSYVFSMGRTSAEALNHIRNESDLEEHSGPIMSGKLPNELSTKVLSTDQSKYRGTAASPSKITWSGNNLIQSLFTSKHSNEDALMTETESLLAEIASAEGGKATLTPKFVSSPGRMFEKKLSASPGLQSSQSRDLLLQSRYIQIPEFDKGRHSTPVRNIADVNLSTATANRGSVSKGMMGELSSPFLEVNHLKNLIEVKTTDKRQDDIYTGKEIFGTIDNLIAPAKENQSQVMHLDVDNQSSRGVTRFEDNLPGDKFRAISHGSVSPSASRNLDELRLRKNPMEFPTASPSRNEFDNEQSFRIHSPEAIQLSGGLENFSAKKRNVELLLRDTQHRTQMTIMQRSPKIPKGGNCDPETMLYPNEGRITLPGHERKKWTDVCFD